MPEEASTGDTPQRLAKEASLLNLWGYTGAIERAERAIFIVVANRLARALGTTLSAMFEEVERGSD